ncbi:hypothetical protein F511_41664 [Dorcoceras hygrometricum]|uniref:Secreted protein n=1 Tax=Dorcoceras hygrometricum TaxID=472368 RepID=A0A2Z7BFY2_9LAMI|nr:hypothetical protein F511_41664 [Dorcoceras hygrometricum]
MMCLRLVVQLVVTICLQLVVQSLAGGNDMLAAGCPVVGFKSLRLDFPTTGAKAKRCRINLFKRRRFAIAIFEYQRLVANHCSFLLILQLHLLNSNHLLIISSAECDDITADVIIADSRSCTSLLIC